jgi:hypothetical protein
MPDLGFGYLHPCGQIGLRKAVSRVAKFISVLAIDRDRAASLALRALRIFGNYRTFTRSTASVTCAMPPVGTYCGTSPSGPRSPVRRTLPIVLAVIGAALRL